jgi:hypothetical protein
MQEYKILYGTWKYETLLWAFMSKTKHYSMATKRNIFLDYGSWSYRSNAVIYVKLDIDGDYKYA